jgi:hypothetical protein
MQQYILKNEDILKSYYEYWLKGIKPLAIMEKLNLSKRKFNELTPDFLTYCRHRLKFDTRESLTRNEEPVLVELTDDRRKEFLEWILSGLPYDKAALMMNVPLITVTDFWFKDVTFKTMVDIASETSVARMTKALFKRGIGYNLPCEEVSTTKGVTAEGVTFDSKTTTKKIKHYPGDITAQKFFLYNRAPDKWSIDGAKTNGSGKGKIIAYIDSLSVINDNLLDKFDEDQKAFDEKYNVE